MAVAGDDEQTVLVDAVHIAYLALRMALDAGEIGLKNDGIFCEVHACLRVCIGGVIQMILRLAEKSIHSMGRLCFRVGQTIAFCHLSTFLSLLSHRTLRGRRETLYAHFQRGLPI